MKKYLLFLALVCSAAVFSQKSGILKGKILDNELNNEPLLFARVAIKGTAFETTTNFNGNFEIENIKPGNYIVTIGFSGYEGLEVPIEVNENSTTEILKSLSAKSIVVMDVVSVKETKVALRNTENAEHSGGR